ncbi:hypothetical protein A2Z41_03910 [Microgenomates group bacterium RBG_19FT_COMBO_39_10]|nr:MAG: hypothetical protein A2Z41_03910 [Microgenomates group bacterium RBG_19FT_COMBO_39_10]
MSIRKPTAKAICRDCWDEIEGSFSLRRSEMVAWMKDRLVIRAEGDLTELCVEHHQTNRVVGNCRLPQHGTFVVFDGSGMFGMMEVRDFASDHHFETEDDEIQQELFEKTRSSGKERGY